MTATVHRILHTMIHKIRAVCIDYRIKTGKVFYGQEPPSGESTECGVQLSTTCSNVSSNATTCSNATRRPPLGVS